MSKECAVIDSSVWIEVLSKGPLFPICQKTISKYKNHNLIVSTIVIFEVYRKLRRHVSEDLALSTIAYLNQYKIVDLSKEISLLAADLSIQYKLAMADSLVYAFAVYEDAYFITLDFDFNQIPEVINLRKDSTTEI